LAYISSLSDLLLDPKTEKNKKDIFLKNFESFDLFRTLYPMKEKKRKKAGKTVVFGSFVTRKTEKMKITKITRKQEKGDIFNEYI
jgi:hypothetical protein